MIMLEQFLIFTRGGLILWEFGEVENGSPVEALVRFCFMEDRSGASPYTYDFPGASYTLKWTFNNKLGLVFVAVFHRILNLPYVDDLLEMVKRDFSKIYEPERMDFGDFKDTFLQLQMEAEKIGERLKNSNDHQQPDDQKHGNDAGFPKRNAEKESGSSVGIANNGNKNPEAFDKDKLKMMIRGNKAAGKKKSTAAATVTSNKKAPRRVWNNPSPKEITKLDFSDHHVATDQISEGTMYINEEINVSSDSESESDSGTQPNVWFSSIFDSIGKKANLEKADLEPALKAIKDNLVTKNVSENVAELICESISASLDGKHHAFFTTISSTARAAVEAAIARILTPTESFDIVRAIQAKKERGKPYVVVFVGVNGVGKSTNLAKLAYRLTKKHNFSVMMAACDTFRSGAIEQLRVHSSKLLNDYKLNVPLFEKGYEKNPSFVAKQAVKEAVSDVVLIDTAGRMQDNEPLMQELTDLVGKCEPDLVLFAGEAQAGNGIVDQLQTFQKKLLDEKRKIDGILLTKFDMVQGMVGAAVSMVYESRLPVMFVGVGQDYPHLKDHLNAKEIAKTLLN